MIHAVAEYTLLAVAAIPFIYYLLALYSTARFFTVSRREGGTNTDFLPPVSCLKPIKGLDEDAYENYASFCRQDFPERQIRLLFGSGRNAINDKVGRLTRLTTEAKYDLFVITDGDVRVRPDY